MPLARGLGWYSVGLGVAGVIAPDAMADLIGVKNTSGHRAVLRFVGIRELLHGVLILSRSSNPAPGVWTRVAGDVMDVIYLSSQLAIGDARAPVRTTRALIAVLGVTALDLYSSLDLRRRTERGPGGQSGQVVKAAITVRRSQEEVYRFWRDFQNLPRFMDYLQSVEITGDRRTHWRTVALAGKTVEWDAEIIDDRPNEFIAWRTLPDSDVEHSGQVRFVPAPGGRGTEIHVEMRYEPPAGRLGSAIAKLFGKDADQQVNGDLRRFKQVLETGEIVRSEATIKGNQFPQRPAQPPERVDWQVAGRR